MQATMMHAPMTVRMIMEHGVQLFPDSRISCFDGAQIEDYSYRQIADNANRLANALKSLGVNQGDRVGTFCWNHAAHMEAYLAVPSMGCVLHTVNIRLAAEQIAYVINHAEDKVLLVDSSLIDVFEAVVPLLKTVAAIVFIGHQRPKLDGLPSYLYADLIQQGSTAYDWPNIDESSAAGVCYTSGTTGNPKGIVYSHKTTFVHSLASRATDTFGISEQDRILLLPAMFHANSWGLPFSGWLSGSDIVMPESNLDVASIIAMIKARQPTFTAMVPTILGDLLRASAEQSFDMSTFRMIVSGGSAVAPSMIDQAREQWGVPVLQGWGMTETSPLCALSHPPREPGDVGETHWRAKSGRPVPGVQVRAVDAEGECIRYDGQEVGELQLRGPWVTGSYYQDENPDAFTEDGWLRTGDVGCIDERHYVQLTDRTKDVIKSGGEWISSIDLENALLAHPQVAEAAVIAIDDQRWQERPLAIIVSAGDAPAIEQLRDFLSSKVAKFWIPEYWAFADNIDKTSVGKIDKKRLRSAYADGVFNVVYQK